MALAKIERVEELYELVEEIGFLPFFSGGPAGFSLMDITRAGDWWSEDPQRDPWEWRKRVAAERRVVYAKLFDKKAGFVSREYYPYFANYRRDGYDFDALYEEGKAKRSAMLLMRQFEDGGALRSYELKSRAGFGAQGEKGFEGAVTALQMQTYLLIAGFARRENRRGEEYGWPVSVFATPESALSPEWVTEAYDEEPAASFERLVARAKKSAPMASEKELRRFLR